MKKLIVIVAILAAAAACGGAGSSGTTAGSAPFAGDASGQPAAVGGNPPVKSGSTGAPDQVGSLPSVVPAVQGPQVIRTAQLTVTVGSGQFDLKLANVRALVQLQGGFISGTDAQANPVTHDQIRTGVISFMVPAAKFDDTIDQLSKLGKVQNEHISGQDVSAQYVDLQARLANEVAQRNATLALLRRANTISDIIAVQTQIGQITGQIEQLKGQIQYIDHNTTYSTVTVSLLESGAPIQTTTRDSWGFVSSISDAAHNFVTTINYVITGLGAIGPIVILLWLGYLVWRRSGRPGWPAARHA
jgi:ABC-type Fe3+-hydroxamate transport system substrate-binding protein